uniref:Fic family protein n=1 Tax=Prevotella sp. GTC17260 TaxID=3236796 RepID=A0AB33JJY1_9BACT
MYTPPFTITAKIVNQIADISAQIERYAIKLEQDDTLRLRKANRIKTIHSSLAIEGNTLSENEVKEIFEGKTVVAPFRQIQEVKNALSTYDIFNELNPFDITDLLRAHGTMMRALTDDAGHFRRGNVGVFSEQGMVHIAPPADRVPYLIEELFSWLKKAQDHLLIRSCVFHYEFEFIHPFSDGNGRTGRLWQSLILSKLHPLFSYLPVENIVHSNQEQYYEAIAAANDQANSTPFIEFMLDEILNTLKSHQGHPLNKSQGLKKHINEEFKVVFGTEFGVKFGVKFGVNEKQTLLLLAKNPLLTSSEIAQQVGISQRAIEKQLQKFRQLGIIERNGSDKTGRWEVCQTKPSY